MPEATLEVLRQATRKLQAGLERLQPQPPNPAALKPEDLAGLLADLSRAASLVRGIPSASVFDAEMKKEIWQYRATVEQLAQILPSVHGRLLTEKARLEIVQSHMTAAAAWAQASRKTL
jgi:hypothetical protein